MVSCRYRAVVGAGLVIPLSIGRVELNYTKGVRTFKDAGTPHSPLGPYRRPIPRVIGKS